MHGCNRLAAWAIDGSCRGRDAGEAHPKSEVRSPKSEIRNPKSEIRNPKTHLKSKIRRSQTAIPRTEPRSRRATLYRISKPRRRHQNTESRKSKIQNPKSKIQRTQTPRHPDTLPGEHALCLLLQQLLNLQRLRGTDHPRHLLESFVFICSPQPPLATVVALHFSEWFQNLRQDRHFHEASDINPTGRPSLTPSDLLLVEFGSLFCMSPGAAQASTIKPPHQCNGMVGPVPIQRLPRVFGRSLGFESAGQDTF